MKLPLLVLFAALALAGCASFTTPPPGTPALVLDKEQTLHYYGNTWTVTLPAGKYVPVFQADDGMFYRSPTVIVQHALGSAAVNGGIFLPATTEDDQRQAFWIDYNGSHPHIPLREKIVFRLER